MAHPSRFAVGPARFTMLVMLGGALSLAPFYLLADLRGLACAAAATGALLVGLSALGLVRPAWRMLGRVAGRRGLAVALVGIVALGVAAGLSLIRPPVPASHDEFSYLLAADTFAQGRLTNPTHPLWEHFESFHIIHRPTYASKYPPAQGLALAAGQWLTGRPIVGAWLSFALACSAACWMLQGWTTPRWALLGGLIAALHPGFQGGFFPRLAPFLGYSWSQSYWGGAMAMLGGALLYGALPRIMRRPRAAYALAIGLGLALLANSRPFEGLVVSIPAGLALLGWLLRSKSAPILAITMRVLLPLATALSVAAAATMTYNAAVTGQPLRLPYQVHMDTYESTPMFWWKPLRLNLSYNNDAMNKFYYGWQTIQYKGQQTLSGWARIHLRWLAGTGAYFVGPLAPALLLLPGALRRRPVRFAAAAALFLVVVHQICLGMQAHYLAPAAGLFLLLVAEGLRRLYTLRCGRWRVGRLLALVVAALVPLELGLAAVARATYPRGWEYDRARVAAQLESTEGRHLVIVRYQPEHNPHIEWVYNRADIDGAKVVWARALGPQRDRALLDYFQDRRVWLLDADAQPPRLEPYRPDPTDRRP
ncbi:MAG: hypothetical protein IRY99_01540 [Isosphaeraceae bacterium]|nr:hypothetical protein [Isosphaeraceae bacterium]